MMTKMTDKTRMKNQQADESAVFFHFLLRERATQANKTKPAVECHQRSTIINRRQTDAPSAVKQVGKVIAKLGPECKTRRSLFAAVD